MYYFEVGDSEFREVRFYSTKHDATYHMKKEKSETKTDGTPLFTYVSEVKKANDGLCYAIIIPTGRQTGTRKFGEVSFNPVDAE